MCVAIPIALAIASTAVSAYGAYSQAKAQKGALQYQERVAQNNAQLAEYAAQDAERRGAEDAARARRQTAALRGTQRATMAARGLDLNAGTPLSLLEDTDYLGEVDQATISRNTANEAWRLRNQKENYVSDAAMYRTGASNVSPGLSLATSLVNSGSMVASKWDTYRNAR